MDSNTKKMLYYGGGAILVGAVAFFVYSFFKRDEFVLGNTSVTIGDSEVDNSSQTGGFKPPKEEFSGNINWTPTPLSELWNKIK